MATCPVEAESDVLSVQKAAREAARALGFTAAEADELAIVASELATNILKYGTRGSVTFSAVSDPEREPGLCIAARDIGPAFCDFATALLDGCDDSGPIAPEALLVRRGLGTGLGAVRRFTDRVEHEKLEEGGKVVRALRYVRRASRRA